MPKAKIYIETSIVSYLTARTPSGLLAAAWKKTTEDWWRNKKDEFHLCISQLVLSEARDGNPEAAARRIDALKGMEILPISEEADSLAEALVNEGAVPQNASEDALHIAVASVHSMDFLLTWNCKHIDNAQIRSKLKGIIEARGFRCPEIATPMEFGIEGGENYE